MVPRPIVALCVAVGCGSAVATDGSMSSGEGTASATTTGADSSSGTGASGRDDGISGVSISGGDRGDTGDVPRVPCEEVSGPREMDVDIRDAEYSRALDRVATIGSSPPGLLVFDPAAIAADASLPLVSEPTALSLGPDGDLPEVDDDGRLVEIHGMFVFFSADGSRIHVLAQVDPLDDAMIDWVALTI